MTKIPTLARRIIAATRVEDRNAVSRMLDDCDTHVLRDLVVNLAHRAGPVTVPLEGPVMPTHDDLVAMATTLAAHRFNTTPESVRSSSRRREDVEARQVVFYALRLALGLSYPDLGTRFDRDHTSVLHGVSKVGETPRLRRVASEIANQIGWDRDVNEVAS